MDQAQIRIRLIVDDAEGKPTAKGAARSGMVPSKTKTTHEKKRDQKKSDISLIQRIKDYDRREKKLANKKRRSMIGRSAEAGKRVTRSAASRIGGGLFPTVGGPGGVSSVLGTIGAKGAGVAAFVGALESLRTVVPTINAFASQVAGVPDSEWLMGISENINRIFSTVTGHLSTVGKSIEYGGAALAAGMEGAPEAALRYQIREGGIEAQMQGLRSRWQLERNRVIARELADQSGIDTMDLASMVSPAVAVPNIARHLYRYITGGSD